MATSINSYSVSLALDAKDYIKNSALSRSETSSLTRQINQARTPADNYERSIKLLDKALKSGTITQDTYTKLLAKQSDTLEKASRKTTALADSAKRLFLTYVSIRAITSTVGGGIRLAADAEDAQIQFKVLLKSASEAEKLLGNIKQFAASTPFQFPELRDAGRLLLAFGFSSKEVIGTMEMLGNISSATGSSIGELAELVGKAKVQNTIYSEDLNQLLGRGINVLPRLAKMLGTTEDQVKKFASEGKIHFSDLLTVMQAISAEDFPGLMEERSKTLNGEWSTLHDNLQSIQSDMGTGLLPMMKKLSEYGTEWAQSFKLGAEIIGDPTWAKRQAEKEAQLKKEGEDAFRVLKRQWKGQFSRGANMSLRPGTTTKAFASGQVSGFGSFDPLTFGQGVAEGLAGGAGGIADHFSGMFSQLGQTVIWSDQMSSDKVAAAIQEDPAIASLEAGTQEAYAFLTQGMKESESAQKLLVEQQKKEAEANRKLQEKNYTVLNKIHDVLAANGWAKARN